MNKIYNVMTKDFNAEVAGRANAEALKRLLTEQNTGAFELQAKNGEIDLPASLFAAVEATAMWQPAKRVLVTPVAADEALTSYVDVLCRPLGFRARTTMLDQDSIVKIILMCRCFVERNSKTAAAVPEFTEFELTLIHDNARRAYLKCYVGWDKQVRVQTYDEAFERFMANKEVKQL